MQLKKITHGKKEKTVNLYRIIIVNEEILKLKMSRESIPDTPKFSDGGDGNKHFSESDGQLHGSVVD